MNRRSLLKLAAAGAAIPMTLVACDDETLTLDDDPADSGDVIETCNTATSATGDSDTHGHTLLIPAADLASGLGGTYTSTGGDHDHTVTLTGDDMSDLLDFCEIEVSSNDTHAHTWTLSLPAS